MSSSRTPARLTLLTIASLLLALAFAGGALAATWDFNNNGRSDILWRNLDDTLAVWLMNGTTADTLTGIRKVTPDWLIVGVADFNKDGHADLLWWNPSSGAVSVWLLVNGNWSATKHLGFAPLSLTAVGAGDVDGDTNVDLVWRDDTTGQVVIWFLGGPDGTTVGSTGTLGAAPGFDWTLVAVADFNGDGNVDLLWRRDTGEVAIWFLNGATIASTVALGTVPLDWTVVGVGHFNRGTDANADILWRRANGALSFWLINAAGVLAVVGGPTVSPDWAVVGVRNFDGDAGGNDDLLWRNADGNVGIWEMLGTTLVNSGSPGAPPIDWEIVRVEPFHWPTITSADNTTFTVGVPGTFTVTTMGFPDPALTRTGDAPPSGVTFVDHGNGTGTLSGTPAGGTAGTYTFTFTAANGIQPDDTQTFTLTVTDFHAPAVNAATFAVAENSANGTVVGTVTFTDPDPGETHTFAIIGGNPGGAFAIHASTGQITVANTAALDFETTPSFSLTVQVTDNHVPPLSGSNTITVNLTNVNEAPVVNAATFGVAEHSPNGTNVGTPVTFTDPDAGQTHTFSITAGNTGGAFAIHASTGQITVANSTALDAGGPQFLLTVQVADNGAPAPVLTGTATITVNVTDVNDAPVVTAATFGIAENSPNGTAVGTVTFTDADAGQVHTFSITGGNTGGAFAIDPGTGAITVATSAALNFETTPQFLLTVQVQDNGAPVQAGSNTITINLTNVNEAPVVNAATVAVPEHSPNGTAVHTVTFTDPDVGQTHTFSITAGNTGGAFAIDAGTGAITVANSAALDAGAPQFLLTVQVLDNGAPALSGTATITVNVTGINDPPVVDPATFSIPENSANGTNVGTPVTFTDPDAGQTHTYSITAGNTGNAFTIDASTGQITVLTSAALDRETTPQFLLTVQVQDNGAPVLAGTATITINLTNVNEAPVAQSQSESTPEDTAILITLTATDVDSLSLTPFTIVSAPTRGLLSAVVPDLPCTPNGSGGTTCTAKVTYTPTANLNGPDSFTFKVNDGSLDSNEGTISITVGAAPDAPVANSQSTSTGEDTAKLITLTGIDADGNTLTFAIDTTPAHGGLGPLGAPTCDPPDVNGARTCRADVTYTPALNFASPPNDSFSFKVNDGTTDSAAGTVTITVTSSNDAPVASDVVTTTNEDTAKIITLTATDVDHLTVTFSIVAPPAHGGLSAVNPIGCIPNGTGGSTCTAEVTYTPTGDFFSPPDDSFTYKANDSIADSNTATVTITVTSVPDAPAAGSQSVSTPEDTDLVITLTGTDPDSASLTSFNIATGPTNGSIILGPSAPVCNPVGSGTSCTSTVTYRPNTNFFSPPNDSFTFTVTDGTLTSPPGTVTITVNGINDPPSFTLAAGPAATNEDAGAINVPNFVTGITAGPGEDATQTVTIVITNNTNAALFSAGPTFTGSGATRNLTYTSAPNANGSAVITVEAQDTGLGAPPPNSNTSASQQFTITVNAVNDKPVAQNKPTSGTIDVFTNMKRTGIDASLLTGVTDADSGVNGCAPTFSVASITNGTHGTVSNVNLALGTFDFEPEAGFTGTATVNYTVSDNGCPGSATSDPATISLNVTGTAIWFVDPNLGVNGTGTLASPFNSLASANTAKGTNANHRIFVYDSTDPDGGATTAAGVGVTLDAAGGQWLVGQGVTGASFDAVMSITPPAGTIARPGIGRIRPVIQGTVAMNGNTSVVRGLNITTTGATAGLTGGAVTGVTVGEANVTTATGTAVNLNGTGGTVSIGNVTSVGGTAVSINAGSGTVDVTGTISRTGAAATGISVTNRTSGTITFSGGTKTLSTSTSTAVNLATNGGATINFTNGGLDIDTTTGTGFTATGGGIVNVGGSNNNVTAGAGATNGKGIVWNGVTSGSTVTFNDVSSTTGTAVDVTSSGATAFTFNDVSSTTGQAVKVTTATGAFTFHAISANGGTTGISVNSATGSFTVNGTGTTDDSGGTVQNASTRGAEFISSNNITLKNMNFTGNGTTGTGVLNANCADALVQSTAGVPAGCQANVYLQSTTTVVLNNVKANQSNAIGIWGNNVDGLTLTNVKAQENGDEVLEDGVQLVNLKGTVTVTGGTFKDNASRSFEVQNNVGAPTITITGAFFGNTNFPTAGGTAPSPSNSTAASTVLLATNGSAGAFITSDVKNSTFDKAYSLAFHVDMSSGTNHQNVTFGGLAAGQKNTVTTSSQGVSMVGTNSGGLTASVLGNDFNNDETLMDTFSTTNINFRRGGGGSTSGDWNVTIDGNKVGLAGNLKSGCETVLCFGISADDQGSTSGTFTVVIQNNEIRNVGGGIQVGSANAGAHTVRATIINNVVQEPDAAPQGGSGLTEGNGIIVFSGTSATATTFAKIEDNDVDGGWDDVGNNSNIRVRHAGAAGSTFFLCNFVAASSAANVAAHLTAENPLSSAPAGFAVGSASIGAGLTVQNGCP